MGYWLEPWSVYCDFRGIKARTMQCVFCHRAWHPQTRRQARSSPRSAQGLPIQPGWPHCPMQKRQSTLRRAPPELPRVASTSLQAAGYRPPLRCFAVRQIGKWESCSSIRRRNTAGRRRREASGSAALRPASRWQMRKTVVAHSPPFRLQGILTDSKRSNVVIRGATFGGSRDR